jgi:KDO2-lipid IV(A) lauroyltransferase
MPDLNRDERERVLDGVFHSIARLLVALARFPDLNARNIGSWISYEGLENYQAAKSKGCGVLIATAHFGNWELSAFAHALMTEPMKVMIRPLDNPLVDELVETRRKLSGNVLLEKKDAARTVIKALRNNEAVGILIDQNTTPAEGVFIDFFGKKACASSAFVKLAHHTGAAVLPGYALWDEATRRYVLHFLPEVPMTGDVEADTQRVHSVFEQVIRQRPEQWMWIHRRWKTRPSGEEGLY